MCCQCPNVCFPLTSPATGSCPAAASQRLTVLSARGLWAAQDYHPCPRMPGAPHEPHLPSCLPVPGSHAGCALPSSQAHSPLWGRPRVRVLSPRTQPLLPRLSSCPSLPGCRSGSGAPGAHSGRPRTPPILSIQARPPLTSLGVLLPGALPCKGRWVRESLARLIYSYSRLSAGFLSHLSPPLVSAVVSGHQPPGSSRPSKDPGTQARPSPPLAWSPPTPVP